ncbi:unnamed protein product [Notodromas monacha]|uniref:ribonuclease H n=1 Tax=Notodromas monacha TaxID=399045 RepID=A0A7R9G7M9_9CRUS|nr:unnamed protein product [Notodromas monacha]CAG0912425.1 unnamed protein product [Notodromas monacha]
MAFYTVVQNAVDVQSTSSGRSNNGSPSPNCFQGFYIMRPVTEEHDDKRRGESDPSSKKLETKNVVYEEVSLACYIPWASFEKPKILLRILQQTWKAKIADFEINPEGYAICSTDGYCNFDLKTSGVGVWFGKDHVANISEPLPVPGTSDRAELTAILYAIIAAKEAGLKKLLIRADSTYAKNCVTVWIPMWKRNNWRVMTRKRVQNLNEIRAIDLSFSHMDVDFKWVPMAENRDADQLAKAGAAESYGSK